MKTLRTIVTLADTLASADTAVEQWTGSNLAVAPSRSSACYRTCTNVRRCPSEQCRRLDKSGKRT